MATVYKRGGKANRDGYYYVSWFDHTGKRRSKCARTTDKAAAERIVAKLEADAALRRDRVIDPTLDEIQAQAQRTIESHLADYEAKLRAANRTEKHISSTLQFIREIAAAASFTTAADIAADGVAQYAAGLLEQGRSARTVQAHLNAMTSFTRWLARRDKLLRDPLIALQKPSPKADRRRDRRMLLPEEWQWLRSVTLADDSERFGMSARERVLLYATAVQTGLRSGELRSLTRARMFLDSARPFITCKAGSTKNRKTARQYIQGELAVELRQHIATKAPQAPLFALPAEFRLAAMLRADLADARRKWLQAAQDADERLKREQSDFLADVNHDRAVLDFHALRHTCGAWLALSGTHPKAVQAVMRHASIVLSMDTYGHLFPGQEAETVARLPSMMGVQPEALRATGTDDGAAIDAMPSQPKSAQRVAQQSGRSSLQTDATACELPSTHGAEKEGRNLFPAAALCDSVQLFTTEGESSGAGTRTPDTRIMIPLL